MPTYTELTEGGILIANTNERRFKIVCEAFGCKTVGEGANKKMAKHEAAKKLLRKLQNQNDDSDDNEESQNYSTSDFVSNLLDYCVLREFPKPVYILKKQVGPSHAPEFTIECQVGSVTTYCETILMFLH
jgi:dsRNA-specific ribonuclease